MVRICILYFLLIFSVDGMCAAKSSEEFSDVDWKDAYADFMRSHTTAYVPLQSSPEKSLDFEKKSIYSNKRISSL